MKVWQILVVGAIALLILFFLKKKGII